ncbi:MAG: cell division protein ZapA [Lachnospiraceae bacterium]|jgi:cell division protein ZapA|nr:cell division protein ZapA [Lachnospiraceae bacterium]
MSSKNDTEVIINGKIYTLSGYESEEYLQKVATYMNNKITELKAMDGYKRLNVDMQRILLELNIADDYFKAKKQADSIEGELDSKDKQLYDVKHELIAAQIQVESLEKENSGLQKQINELQIKIAKLETEVEDTPARKRKNLSE